MEFSNQMEKTIDSYNMDERYMHVRKKLVPKGDILYNSMYVTFWKGKIIRTENKSVVATTWVNGVVDHKRITQEDFWVTDLSCITTVVVGTWFYASAQTQRTIYHKECVSPYPLKKKKINHDAEGTQNNEPSCKERNQMADVGHRSPGCPHKGVPRRRMPWHNYRNLITSAIQWGVQTSHTMNPRVRGNLENCSAGPTARDKPETNPLLSTSKGQPPGALATT